MSMMDHALDVVVALNLTPIMSVFAGVILARAWVAIGWSSDHMSGGTKPLLERCDPFLDLVFVAAVVWKESQMANEFAGVTPVKQRAVSLGSSFMRNNVVPADDVVAAKNLISMVLGCAGV